MNDLVPISKESLTPAQFAQLADVPPELEWLANITNPKTRRAYKVDVEEFSRFAGLPDGFRDQTYQAWERDYKVNAHREWNRVLNQSLHKALLRKGEFEEAALHAVRIEARTNLIFSFEKMALRDAIKSAAGAKAFTTGLYDYLYGLGAPEERFERWCQVVSSLPRKQTRVFTWPIVTVFGFMAQPDRHIFLKPNVTRKAALEYGFPLQYEARPNWTSYSNFLRFTEQVRRDIQDLHPRDMIDLQSFLWVQGSNEYEE